MKPTAVSDSSFDAEVLRPRSRSSSISGPSGAAPARWWRRSSTNWRPTWTGRVEVAKVNIDENPQTPRKYGVRGIPTMILFKDGEVTATKIGAEPKSKL